MDSDMRIVSYSYESEDPVSPTSDVSSSCRTYTVCSSRTSISSDAYYPSQSGPNIESTDSDSSYSESPFVRPSDVNVIHPTSVQCADSSPGGSAPASTKPSDESLVSAQPSSSSSTSSTGSFCRICQQGRNETSETLQDSRCGCRGSLGLAHHSCLLQWVATQGTRWCEICRQRFESIGYEEAAGAVARRRLGARIDDSPNETMVPHTLGFQLSQMNPPPALCNDSRRFWFVVIALMLTFATSSSVVMVIFMHEDSVKPRPTNDYMNYSDLSISEQEVFFSTSNENARFGYVLSVIIMTFCATLNTGIFGMWLLSECVLWPRERLLARHQELLSIRALVHNMAVSRA